VINTINKLAKTVPEPHEITFEEIPEIEYILENYYKPEKTYHVSFQCSVLFGYGMTKEEAEKKRDEWNAGHDYEPPAGVFEDSSDFPELYLEQFDDEFKLLLRDYIKRKKNQSGKSIFDSDSWCWDMDKAPKKGCHLLLKNYNSDDFFIMYDCYKNPKEDYWRSHSLPNKHELWSGFKTDNIINNNCFKCVSLDEYEEVAWRPLAKLPIGETK
jgi:hypothetical protein